MKLIAFTTLICLSAVQADWSEYVEVATNVATATGGGVSWSGDMARIFDGDKGAGIGGAGWESHSVWYNQNACTDTTGYVEMDLKEQVTLDALRVYRYYGDTRRYCSVKVDVSTDKAHWDTVYTTGTGWDKPTASGGDLLSFSSRKTGIRYVRYYTGKNDQNLGAHLQEIVPLRRNYADDGVTEWLPLNYVGTATATLSSSVTWSSSTSRNNSTRTVDGLTASDDWTHQAVTYEQAACGDTVGNVLVDLGTAKAIDGVRYFLFYDEAETIDRRYCDVKVEISQNNADWETTYTGQSDYTTADIVLPDGNMNDFGQRKNVRYIRLSAGRSNKNTGVHIIEVQPVIKVTAAPSSMPSGSPSSSPSGVPSGSPSSSPVGVPSSNPSGAPSPSPSKAPTSAPTRGSIVQTMNKHTPLLGSSHGDPHFSLWSGEKYDWHGACDLVLLSLPKFANDLGLKILIRTKIETWWSFIEAAIIQIGNDEVLELRGGSIGADPNYWVNGQKGGKDVATNLDLLSLQQRLGPLLPGLKVHYKEVSAKQHKFRIDLNRGGDAISIETFKEWVAVNVKAVQPESFAGALGLLGSYPSGEKVAPDGVTFMEDTDSFAKSWQVQSSEPMLFHNTAGPQHPEQCMMPEEEQVTSQKRRRRLGESLLSSEDAERACAHASTDKLDACVFDVLATNDKDFAGSY